MIAGAAPCDDLSSLEKAGGPGHCATILSMRRSIFDFLVALQAGIRVSIGSALIHVIDI